MTGPEHQRLCDRLTATFPERARLVEFVRWKLDQNLEMFTAAADDLSTTAYKLVDWAQARGELPRLQAALDTAESKHRNLPRDTPSRSQKSLSRKQCLLTQSFISLASRTNEQHWRDRYFTELEAEVAVDFAVKRSRFSAAPTDQRLEKSLTNALLRCKDKLILLEGDPGSGKSVSLRHVAQTWTADAGSKNAPKVVPLYLNLQRLYRTGTAIDRTLIESFVHQELHRLGHRDIEDFIKSDFHDWCREGRFLFLFDSFDELKDVLGSTERDSIVDQYAGAIQDFAYTQNTCRVVVASRRFRGPKRAGWAHFLIRPLSESCRIEFVRRHVKVPALVDEIVGQLQISTPEFRELSSNPLMLTLLCSHANEAGSCPHNAHQILNKFVERRLQRDQYRISQKLDRTIDSLRLAAELLALELSSNPELGVWQTRRALLERVGDGRFKLDDSLLDALELVGLLRIERSSEASAEDQISFAHLRFQEFFVSSHVLQNRGIVAPQLLLTDYRWREACVAMFQHSSQESLRELIETASKLVLDFKRSALPSADEPGFFWPPKALHVLEVLQAGFAYRSDLPGELAEDVSWLVKQAIEHGNILDQKWGLEIAGLAPEVDLAQYIDYSLLSGSRILREAAFLQIHKIRRPTPELRKTILEMLEEMATSGKLREERFGIELKLGKLPDSQHLILVARALQAIPSTDVVLQVIALAYAGAVLELNGINAGTYAPHAVFAGLTLLTVPLWTLRGRGKFMGIMVLRMVAVASLAIVLDVSRTAENDPLPGNIALALIIPELFLALWPLLALEANARGLCVKGWQRLFAPFSLLIWWRWSKRTQIFVLFGFVEFALLALFLPMLDRTGAMGLTALFLLGGGALYFGHRLIRASVNRVRDSSHFRGTIDMMAKSKDLRDVLTWLGRFRTPGFRIHGIRVLRGLGVFQGNLSHSSQVLAREILGYLEFDRWAAQEVRRELRRDMLEIDEEPADDTEWIFHWYFRYIGADEVHTNKDLADEFALALEPFVKDDGVRSRQEATVSAQPQKSFRHSPAACAASPLSSSVSRL